MPRPLSFSVAPIAQAALSLCCISLGLSACGGGGDAAPSSAATTYTVSGQVMIPANTQVDSDVNDPSAPYASNDSISAAQALPNPVTLGGYVNVAGQGRAGRSQTAGDRSDVFRIDAIAGQALTLTVGNPTEGNVELVLYAADQQRIDQSIGNSKTKSLVFPATGTYFAQAYAEHGASTYVLTVGQSTAPASTDELRTSSDFVPGEVIVRWKTGAQARGGSAAMSLAAASMRAHALSALSEPPEGDVLLQLNAAPRAPSSTDAAQRALMHAVSPESDPKVNTLEAIKQLRSDPQIEYAEPNYIRRAQFIPDDALYPTQWNVPLINLPQAWDITQGDSAVTVAVVDTGLLLNHPELQGQWVPGYDFVSSVEESLDGDGIDNDPSDPGDHIAGHSSSFHGTHVAGIIASLSNNGAGVTGVAPGVRVMPVRVLGRTGGTSFDLQQGVLYAAGLANSSGTRPSRRADIINLSLSGAAPSQSEQNVFALARAQGVIVVAAAGNEHSHLPSYPAAYNGVISVSAVTVRQNLASYSNFGSTIDVAAPGGDREGGIVSTMGMEDASNSINFGHTGYSGTSMATPHVAGVLALMKSVKPSLTPAEVDTLLGAGRLTTDLGAPGRDDSFGHGLIDAHKAVQAAQGSTPVPGILVATPASINLPATSSKQTITLGNGGTQALGAPTIEVSAPWLIVTPPSSSDGLGAYTVRVNRTGLAPGSYTGSVRFVSGTQSIAVSVLVQVTPSGARSQSTLGQHYVLLADASTQKIVQVLGVQSQNGAYHFEFTGVAPGTYWLFSGSDPNNDGIVCSLGESCGAYVNRIEPRTITVGENLSDQDFDAGFTATEDGLPTNHSEHSGTQRMELRR